MPASVSILLLMKNELANMERSFPRLLSQDYGGEVEYVYIDSGSTDGTLEYMASHGVAAHEIPPTEFHHGRTRNLAASMAKNDILVFLSGDALPTNMDWLQSLVAPFEDDAVAATYGRQIAPEGTSKLRAYAMEYEYPTRRQERVIVEGQKPSMGMFRMSNANAAVRRQVWEQFKFDETVVMSEDVGLCYNVLMNGMKVVYVPEAAVYHCHDRSLWYEFQKAFDSAISLKRMGVLGNPKIGSELRYGLHRLYTEGIHWLKKRRPDLALWSAVTSVTKWVGVQFGKRGDSLPRWLTARISAGVEKMYD